MDGIYTNVYSYNTIRLESFITSLKHSRCIARITKQKYKNMAKNMAFL